MCKRNERIEAAYIYIFIHGVYSYLEYYYVDLLSNRIVSLALLSNWPQSPGYFTTMTGLSSSTVLHATLRCFFSSSISITILFIPRIHMSIQLIEIQNSLHQLNIMITMPNWRMIVFYCLIPSINGTTNN